MIYEYEVLDKKFKDGLHYILNPQQWKIFKQEWGEKEEQRQFGVTKSFYLAHILFKKIIFFLVEDVYSENVNTTKKLNLILAERLNLYTQIVPLFDKSTVLFKEVQSYIAKNNFSKAKGIKKSIFKNIVTVLKKHSIPFRQEMKTFIDKLVSKEGCLLYTSDAADE